VVLPSTNTHRPSLSKRLHCMCHGLTSPPVVSAVQLSFANGQRSVHSLQVNLRRHPQKQLLALSLLGCTGGKDSASPQSLLHPRLPAYLTHLLWSSVGYSSALAATSSIPGPDCKRIILPVGRTDTSTVRLRSAIVIYRRQQRVRDFCTQLGANIRLRTAHVNRRHEVYTSRDKIIDSPDR
jgi:hypothetical protein